VSEAGVYRCPSCGAPADPKSAACSYCRSALQPVRCPWCFGWTDAAARDCARCGASAEPPPAGAAPLTCPSCRGSEVLSTRAIEGVRLAGCAACGGVWADSASFKKLCEDRAAQTAYMGEGCALPGPKPFDPSETPILYRPCPICAELMNRFNFAGCSGVILDACKPHGVWFDADELRRIVLFIREGGLDVAREHELRDIETERDHLRQANRDLPGPETGFAPQAPLHVAAARGLLAHLLGLAD
jgi:Zn-finger nucleic acid-binding protein